MEHTEPRSASKVDSPHAVQVHIMKKCQCGATLTSGNALCDQCSRKKAFTSFDPIVANPTAGGY